MVLQVECCHDNDDRGVGECVLLATCNNIKWERGVLQLIGASSHYPPIQQKNLSASVSVLEVGRYAPVRTSTFYPLALSVPALFLAYRHLSQVAGTLLCPNQGRIYRGAFSSAIRYPFGHLSTSQWKNKVTCFMTKSLCSNLCIIKQSNWERGKAGARERQRNRRLCMAAAILEANPFADPPSAYSSRQSLGKAVKRVPYKIISITIRRNENKLYPTQPNVWLGSSVIEMTSPGRLLEKRMPSKSGREGWRPGYRSITFLCPYWRPMSLQRRFVVGKSSFAELCPFHMLPRADTRATWVLLKYESRFFSLRIEITILSQFLFFSIKTFIAFFTAHIYCTLRLGHVACMSSFCA